MEEHKRSVLNHLKDNEHILFLFKKHLKLIHVSYLMQQTFLFVSFIMLGFFLFSGAMNVFHFENFSLGMNKTLDDFISLHYVSLFLILLSFFGLISLFNAFVQIKINQSISCLKETHFPVSDFINYFQEDLNKIDTTPIHGMIRNNDNLYGLLLLLIFEKHIEKQDINLIPEYFQKKW